MRKELREVFRIEQGSSGQGEAVLPFPQYWNMEWNETESWDKQGEEKAILFSARLDQC